MTVKDSEGPEIIGIIEYHCYFEDNTSWQYFSRNNFAIDQWGSRSSQTIVSCGIKLERIFLIVSLNKCF